MLRTSDDTYDTIFITTTACSGFVAGRVGQGICFDVYRCNDYRLHHRIWLFGDRFRGLKKKMGWELSLMENKEEENLIMRCLEYQGRLLERNLEVPSLVAFRNSLDAFESNQGQLQRA